MTALLLVALILGGLALYLLLKSATVRQATGLPRGRVTYVDTGAWNRCEQPLFSARNHLTGRPDYLIQVREGVVPVEVKSGPAPAQPWLSHVLQLAAYCLLVEERDGRTPPYGIIKYRDRAFEVDYTPALRSQVVEVVEAMRHDLHAPDVDRSHDDKDRCRACGYREQCKQRLQ